MRKRFSAQRIEELRSGVLEYLSDTCQVEGIPSVVFVNGFETFTRTLLTYNNSVDIPCRVDTTRHFTGRDIFDGETVVSGFEIHFPYNFPLDVRHRILLDSHPYEIIKLLDAHTNAVTISAFINKISPQGAE